MRQLLLARMAAIVASALRWSDSARCSACSCACRASARLALSVCAAARSRRASAGSGWRAATRDRSALSRVPGAALRSSRNASRAPHAAPRVRLAAVGVPQTRMLIFQALQHKRRRSFTPSASRCARPSACCAPASASFAVSRSPRACSSWVAAAPSTRLGCACRQSADVPRHAAMYVEPRGVVVDFPDIRLQSDGAQHGVE